MSAEGDGEASSNGTTRGLNSDWPPPQRSFQGVATNGTHKATASSLNGSSLQNGKQQSREPAAPTTPYFGHNREEVTRILIQALSDMGYHSAAQSVSRDSGYELESPAVAAFRSALLNGSWTEAEQSLEGAAMAVDSQDRAGNGLVLMEGSSRDAMRFSIRQQKYLELLELRDYRQALSVLRTELTPLSQDPQLLHFLSSLLMCQSSEDVKSKADWDGARGMSRRNLLSNLSKRISPSVMLPEHRLAVLLQQVKDRQIDRCKWHTSASSPSLYTDHVCDPTLFPNEVVYELDQPGEVWQIRFSNNGKRLASCGADKHIYIWDMTTFDLIYKLGHDHREARGEEPMDEGVGDLAWSPDDSMLVACERDKCASIWDLKTGTLIQRTKRLSEPVSSCVWAPDGASFILGSFDKAHAICTWSARGEQLYTWTKKFRVGDLAISPDGRWLVAADDQHAIHVYDGQTRELKYDLDLACRGISIRVSRDSKYLLVNKEDAIAQLIDIGSRITVQKYTGHRGGDYTIRSDLGGANESFVISGSEDGAVFIWHMLSGNFVEKLEAHRPRCNAVDWSPTDPCLWASAGDDAKIKL
ncbi:WD domain protein [Cryphonectria parasitica EP155]|uniref:WD domain protein n=1 Tax=Cryphonectria parasitica (strain ATCC 38755 / EP155) TaxID=660469 RepID=A0A9P4YDZ4_CRYP1|nr:WD domain protein [Cryphonectria parasitica EP155]KAF3771233.1 WD domain protein [Cryphonectria parasitica EP155]